MTVNFNAVCPECRKDFEISVELLPLDVELVCAYCGLYFRKEDSPRLMLPHGMEPGRNKPEYEIYRPEKPYRWSD